MKKATHNIEKSRYEYRAKNTLALLFPDEFSGLEKSEKPDWADNMNSIAVEVVRVLDSDFLKERKHFSKKVAGNSKSALPPKVKGELENYKGRTYTARELGISDSDVIGSHCYTMLKDGDMVLCEVEKKIELLKSYMAFNRMYLYIQCDMNFSCVEIDKIFECCHEAQRESEKQFYGMFIDDGVKLYRHDFCDRRTVERSLSDVVREVFIRTEVEIKNV